MVWVPWSSRCSSKSEFGFSVGYPIGHVLVYDVESVSEWPCLVPVHQLVAGRIIGSFTVFQ